VGRILSFAPSNLVDLLLNLERLEVVKLWLVRLKLGVKFVFAALFLVDRKGCEFHRWKRERHQRTPVERTQARRSVRVGERTMSFRSNNTTRPPLSPVAR
jgi:hypothetical protein